MAGYHLPLDGHPEIGNNALIVRQLGFEPVPGEIGEAKGRHIGQIGRRAEPIPATALFELVGRELGREPWCSLKARKWSRPSAWSPVPGLPTFTRRSRSGSMPT